jgi:septal ring factor EnvC (AmiA/AmiB activator)
MGTCERAHTRSQRSKGKHSRNQWKAKAKQRSDHHRYLRKQFARLKAERDQAKQELKETQTRLRQLESQGPAGAVRPKVDVVGLALHLF